jgi:hypothetical protein
LIKWIFAFLLVGISWAQGNSTVITGERPVTIYSGPGRNFRPIRSISQKIEFAASSRLAQGKDGNYYKVLVKFRDGHKQVGYIATDAPVKLVRSLDTEDIEHYSSLMLSKSSVQAAFYVLKNSRMYWTLGYTDYLVPSFYLKPFAGQLLTETSSSIVSGIEMGTDHFFTEMFSFFTGISTGLVFSPRDNAVFPGSASANALLTGTAGIRMNAELAAVSIGFGQTALFNGNNSYLGWNLGFTLEVGL